MATLRELELYDRRRADSVAILVGPNGSGKSTFLRALAEAYRYENVIVVSNTPHDRFAKMRGILRISAGRTDHAPPSLVKRAVSVSLGAEDSSFYQISAIMDYCGYAPRFGFRIEKARHYGSTLDDLRWSMESVPGGASGDDPTWDRALDYNEELRHALAYLKRHDPRDFVWVDASRSALEFSLAREFTAVLHCEAILRRLKVIGRIEVMLQRNDRRGTVIEMQLASSGQLALISSLLFLITQAGRSPIILIDEPENSLHPSWQREYVDKLMAAMSYRDATIIIATHAPLVVTGALSHGPERVSVFRVRDAQPKRLEIDMSASPRSIEEILWEAFGVVTPANHFVSEEIVRVISGLEAGEIGKDEVLELVGDLDARSFDGQQKRFFAAVRTLVEKVENARTATSGGDGEGA